MRIASLPRAARLLTPLLLALPIAAGCAATSGPADTTALHAQEASRAIPEDTPAAELARLAVSEDRGVAAEAIARLICSASIGPRMISRTIPAPSST